MTMIAATAVTMTAMAQRECGNGIENANGCWEETENWMSASDKISNNNSAKNFIFDLTADADQLYTSEDGLMIITESDDSDVTTWVADMQEGVFESGDTYFNISSDVQAMDGMGYTAFYHGAIEGEPMMMQQFMYVGLDGKCYEAQVYAKNFEEWNNSTNSTSYFIASLMKAPTPDNALLTNK